MDDERSPLRRWAGPALVLVPTCLYIVLCLTRRELQQPEELVVRQGRYSTNEEIKHVAAWVLHGIPFAIANVAYWVSFGLRRRYATPAGEVETDARGLLLWAIRAIAIVVLWVFLIRLWRWLP